MHGIHTWNFPDNESAIPGGNRDSLWPAWGTQLEVPFQTKEAVLSQQDPNYLWIPVKETPLSPKWKTGQSQTLVCPWSNWPWPYPPPSHTHPGQKACTFASAVPCLFPGSQDLIRASMVSTAGFLLHHFSRQFQTTHFPAMVILGTWYHSSSNLPFANRE